MLQYMKLETSVNSTCFEFIIREDTISVFVKPLIEFFSLEVVGGKPPLHPIQEVLVDILLVCYQSTCFVQFQLQLIKRELMDAIQNQVKRYNNPCGGSPCWRWFGNVSVAVFVVVDAVVGSAVISYPCTQAVYSCIYTSVYGYEFSKNKSSIIQPRKASNLAYMTAEFYHFTTMCSLR